MKVDFPWFSFPLLYVQLEQEDEEKVKWRWIEVDLKITSEIATDMIEVPPEAFRTESDKACFLKAGQAPVSSSWNEA